MPWENIGGRAEFITFSLDGSSSYWNPISWFTALRGGRAGTSLHPASEPQSGQNQGQNQQIRGRQGDEHHSTRRRRKAIRADLDQPGPVEFRDPVVRQELKKATVWAGVVLAILGVIVLAEPLLLIFAGIVLAAMLDGGTRLLGRVLPIGRGWRLAIVTIAAIGFLVWTFIYAGTELVEPGRAAARGRDPAGQPNPRLGQFHASVRGRRGHPADRQPGHGLARPARLGRVAARSARSPAR